jgi:hypothetical protein
MRILNLLIALVAALTVGCVGLHLYIVEDEMNEIRQAWKFNVELRAANLTSKDALDFARDTQYIALMAEERATELAYKLNVAASIVATLEEHLENAILTVETQAAEIQDLIDQNSELQNNNQWMMDENERLRTLVEAVKVDLEAALAALDEKAIELEETTTELQNVLEELEDLRWVIDNPDRTDPFPDPDGIDITPDEIDNPIFPPEPDGIDITPDEIDNPVLPPKPTWAPPQRLRNPFIETMVEVEVS